MKKLLFFSIATVMLLACSKKMPKIDFWITYDSTSNEATRYLVIDRDTIITKIFYTKGGNSTVN